MNGAIKSASLGENKFQSLLLSALGGSCRNARAYSVARRTHHPDSFGIRSRWSRFLQAQKGLV